MAKQLNRLIAGRDYLRGGAEWQSLYGPYNTGSVSPEPGETAWLFWNVPNGIPDNLCAWTATAVSQAVNAEFYPVPAEQRAELTEVYLLRKGPDSIEPNGPQRYAIRNKGQNPVDESHNPWRRA